MVKIEKILIANRGEIAVRVISTAKKLGFQTVAVFSDADRESKAVALADQAYYIGPAKATESYLKIENIINAAKQAGAQAIHPGYGFLSENADFAQACEDNGLTLIGPSVEAIKLMGNKATAKRIMIDAGVPCIPGYNGEEQDDERLHKEVESIGLPVLIKAAAGGGGKGMRLLESMAKFSDAVSSARSEALSAFGSDELIIEKAITKAHHVEIQVFGDRHGNVIHLGERDCSLQRRHQKVIEEAPSPIVTPEIRERMGEAAINAAKAINYVGAGTVEFLLTPDGEFYFLEMNTRLQVEHPVTELVTGLDLVALQIKVAAGEKLMLTQEDVKLEGHAVEARLYAEAPHQQFMPQTGRVHAWYNRNPQDYARIDDGIVDGQMISPYYDPMLAKLIVHGATRDEACRKLRRLLSDQVYLGPPSNKAFLHELLLDENFLSGEIHTAYIDEVYTEISSISDDAFNLMAAAACLVFAKAASQGNKGWRSNKAHREFFNLHEVHHDRDVTMTLTESEQGYTLLDDEQNLIFANLSIINFDERSLLLSLDGLSHRIAYRIDDRSCHLAFEHFQAEFERKLSDATASDQNDPSIVTSPTEGRVVEVRAALDMTVKKGDSLVIIEAMKMEHHVCAKADGVVSELNVESGQQVSAKQLLVKLEVKNEEE